MHQEERPFPPGRRATVNPTASPVPKVKGASSPRDGRHQPGRRGERGRQGGEGEAALPAPRGTICAQQTGARHEHRVPRTSTATRNGNSETTHLQRLPEGQRCSVTSQGARGSVPETRKRGCKTEVGDERASRGRGRRLNVVKTAAPSTDLETQFNPHRGSTGRLPRNGGANPQVPMKL